MTTKRTRTPRPCPDSTTPLPPGISVYYACGCGRHLGPGWTEQGARLAMTQQPDELLGKDTNGVYFLVRRAEAAWYRWIGEAPRGYLHLLNDLAEEILQRTDGTEPDEAGLDVLAPPMAAWMRRRAEELAPDYPDLLPWMQDGMAAWYDRKPGPQWGD